MNKFKSHTRSLVVLVFVFLFVVSACVRYERIASEAQLGTHRVSVRPSCDSASTNSQRQYEKDGTSRVVFYEFKCGETMVSIRGNLLSVNGKSYGTLNEDDWIAIDYGKVRVNSEVRSEMR